MEMENQIKKSLVYAYFTVGVIFGFGLCMVMRQNAELTLSSYVKMLVFAILIPLIHWAEARTHRGHIIRWAEIRLLGKWNFVILRYILLRGIMVCAIFLGPNVSSMTARSIVVFAAVILVVIGVVGAEEWTECETQHQINQLRSAATSIKVLEN